MDKKTDFKVDSTFEKYSFKLSIAPRRFRASTVSNVLIGLVIGAIFVNLGSTISTDNRLFALLFLGPFYLASLLLIIAGLYQSFGICALNITPKQIAASWTIFKIGRKKVVPITVVQGVEETVLGSYSTGSNRPKTRYGILITLKDGSNRKIPFFADGQDAWAHLRKHHRTVDVEYVDYRTSSLMS